MNEPSTKPLRFHWRLPHGGETFSGTLTSQKDQPHIGLPDLAAQVRFCRQAERWGIESVLTDFGFAKPDPILLAAALGRATKKIKFIIAYRSGLLMPTLFVQQLNTLSSLVNGRFSLNIVAGYSRAEQRSYGDFLSHDERYERTDEFLSICRALWNGGSAVNFEGKYYRIEKGNVSTPFVSTSRAFPEIFVAGSSSAAKILAMRQGTCWLRLVDALQRLREEVVGISPRGLDLGLRLSIISRDTRANARMAAQSLIADLNTAQKEVEFVRQTDSKSIKATHELARTEWLTPILWTGAIRYIGPTAAALVGTPEDIASALMEFRALGISQFILSGWPKLEEMVRFGSDILPLVRKKEAATEISILTHTAARN